MKTNDETVWLDVGPIERESDKAELRQVEGEAAEWIPKSQIKARSPRGRIEVTRWWAAQRGYVDEKDGR